MRILIIKKNNSPILCCFPLPSYFHSTIRSVSTVTKYLHLYVCEYTGCTQNNGAVTNVNNKFISHLTRAQRTPTAAATVQVSHALPAVRFSCLLRDCRASFQDGVAAREYFLCAPF